MLRVRWSGDGLPNGMGGMHSDERRVFFGDTWMEVLCDSCGRTVWLDMRGRTMPVGWLTLWMRDVSKNRTFCSIGCTKEYHDG